MCVAAEQARPNEIRQARAKQRDPHDLASWVNEIRQVQAKQRDPHDLASWVNEIRQARAIQPFPHPPPWPGSNPEPARGGMGAHALVPSCLISLTHGTRPWGASQE